MALSSGNPPASPKWMPIMATLNDIGHDNRALRTNSIIAHCFHEPADADPKNPSPAAWYSPWSDDIYLNLSAIEKSLARDGIYYREARDFDYLSKEFENLRRYTSRYFAYSDKFLRKNPIVDEDGHIDERWNGDLITEDTHTSSYETLDAAIFSSVTVSRLSDSPSAYKKFLLRMLGAYLHETGHTIFSTYFNNAWFKGLNAYQRRVLIIFEELRSERSQLRRMEASPGMIRGAADVVVSVEDTMSYIVSALMQTSEEAAVGQIALNSALILGRQQYNVFTDAEVQPLADAVEDVTGSSRYAEMIKILDNVSKLYQIDTNMLQIYIDQWIDLFPLPNPEDAKDMDLAACTHMADSVDGQEGDEGEEGEGSEGSGSGKDGKGDKGEDEKDGESGSGVGKAGDGEDGDADGEEKDGTSSRGTRGGTGGGKVEGAPSKSSGSATLKDDDMSGERRKTPMSIKGKISGKSLTDVLKPLEKSGSSIRASMVKKPIDNSHFKKPLNPTEVYRRYAARNSKPLERREFEEQDVEKWERVTMKSLADQLRKMSVTDRGKFVTATELPPGKLKSRAAVQRAAEKKIMGSSKTSAWRRTRHTTGHNPPLTVGIATDVSGSMSWSTGVVASLSWILPKAVHEINGNVGAVTFGESVDITVRPGEYTDKKYMRYANDGTELIGEALAILDQMLRLTSGDGVRVLLIFSDGCMVGNGQMELMHATLDSFKKAGVRVVWITEKNTYSSEYNGLPTTPPDVTVVEVDSGAFYSASSGTLTSLTNELVSNIGSAVLKELKRGTKS